MKARHHAKTAHHTHVTHHVPVSSALVVPGRQAPATGGEGHVRTDATANDAVGLGLLGLGVLIGGGCLVRRLTVVARG